MMEEVGSTLAPAEMSIAVVLPVYNEEGSIVAVVKEIYEKFISKYPHSKLFVFEDGSTDKTKEKLAELQSSYHEIAISMSGQRKGYAKAVRDAINSIDPSVYEYILFADSDGQYDPDDFHLLLETLAASDKVDIVMGRRLNRAEPRYRVFLSSTMKFMEKVLFRPPCKDITSALRLMRTSKARLVANKVKFSRYNFWLEFTPRSVEEKLRIAEVDVRYRQREGESNIYSVRRMPRILKNEFGAILRTWWEYERNRALKFLMVGLSGALVILGLTYVLTDYAGLHYWESAPIAIEVSILWAFMLNDTWTFREFKSHSLSMRFARYNLISLVGLSINETVLILLTAYAGIHYLISEVLGILAAFAFNFVASRNWGWGHSRGNEPAQLDI